MKLTACLLLVFVLLSCELFTPDGNDTAVVPEITVAFADSQNGLIAVDKNGDSVADEWVFPLYFPNDTDIAALILAAPDTEIVSTGHVSGATVIVVTMTTDKKFYITGAHIDQIYYRPSGASSEIGYIHPVFGIIDPFFLELPAGGNIEVNPPGTDGTPAQNLFDLDLATALSLWEHMDVDGNGTLFPADQNESFELSCRLFFEGFTDSGYDLPDNYPPPLRLYFTISHTT